MSYAGWVQFQWYQRQAIVSYAGGAYQSLVDSNYNRNPITTTGYWAPYGPSANPVQTIAAGSGIQVGGTQTVPIVALNIKNGTGAQLVSGTGTQLTIEGAISDIKAAATPGLPPGILVVGTPYEGDYTLQNTGILAVNAGTGISVTSPINGAVTVSATGTAGVSSVAGGAGITISPADPGTGAVTVTNTGLLRLDAGDNSIYVNGVATGHDQITAPLTAGAGISAVLGSAVGSGYTIANTGVTGVAVGAGIGVSPSTGVGNVTLSNTGVTSLASGLGTSVGATSPATGAAHVDALAIQQDSSTNFTVSVPCIMNVLLIGGGGGGASALTVDSNLRSGGGGGSGYVTQGTFVLQTGDVIGLAIGAGGTGGQNPSNSGASGGATQLAINGQIILIALGGEGGLIASALNAAWGGNGAYGGGGGTLSDTNLGQQSAGGTGTIQNGQPGFRSTMDASCAGGAGGGNNRAAASVDCTTNVPGGTGGGLHGGIGGYGEITNQFKDGKPGTGPGDGGGGGAYNGTGGVSSYGKGGNGANGCAVYWYQAIAASG